MITHYIYEIHGVKVGCTKDISTRLAWAAKQGDDRYKNGVIILEILHDKTDRQAGDIEWDYAEKLGYTLGQHYAHARENMRKMQEVARTLGAKARKENNSGVYDARIRKKGLDAALKSPNQVCKTGHLQSLGGRALGKQKQSGFQTGKAGKASVLSPNHNSNRKVFCTKCHKEFCVLNLYRHQCWMIKGILNANQEQK